MTIVRFENFPRRAGRAVLFIFLAGSTASIAHAQVPYDLNCKPVELTESQKINEETCAMHAGCRFLVQAPMNAGCKAMSFIRNLGKTDPAIDNSVLIDGATYDLPRPTKFEQLVSDVKVAVHSALGTGAKRDVVQTDDGRVAYYEGGHINSGTGNGAMIYSDGTMARGTFDAKYKLSGAGELITPDGKVRAGEFKDNQLAGQGFVSEKDGNRTVLIEGTFDGDTPVGEVIRNYADGSRVRELWENGKMVARGDRAPKGNVPPPIRRPDVKLATASSNLGDEGLFLVREGNSTKMWELRCRGKATVVLVSPQKPTGQSCERKVEVAHAGEDDFSGKDVIERTLGPPKINKKAGTRPRNYDDSRTPTINQLIAACNAEWLAMTDNGYLEFTGANFVLKFASAPTRLLQDDAQVQAIVDVFIQENYRSASVPIEWRRGAQCYARETLNGRAGQFRTPTMSVKPIRGSDTQGRQDQQ